MAFICTLKNYKRNSNADHDDDFEDDSSVEDDQRNHHSPSSSTSSLFMRRKNNRISQSGTRPAVASLASSKAVPRSHDARNSSSPRGDSLDNHSAGGSSDDSLSYVQLDAYSTDAKTLYDLLDSHLGPVSRIVRTLIFQG